LRKLVRVLVLILNGLRLVVAGCQYWDIPSVSRLVDGLQSSSPIAVGPTTECDEHGRL
jgi:hypothetical protein